MHELKKLLACSNSVDVLVFFAKNLNEFFNLLATGIDLHWSNTLGSPTANKNQEELYVYVAMVA